MTTNLSEASTQWRSRPDDERFESLLKLQQHVSNQRASSQGIVLNTRDIEAQPNGPSPTSGYHSWGLVVTSKRPGAAGSVAIPSHWSFGQLAQRAGAPASYLRTLPSPMAADCINYGLLSRDAEDIGLMLRRTETGALDLAAVTGPGYGRVWNKDIVDALVRRFGDGITGAFRVPGEFGKRVEVTKANTTLYASDRDLFVFLADEEHRIELPNRRDGQPGSLARGFFMWNSEVGSATFGVKTFLFDYVCHNRIVWGADDVQEFRIRHTSSAPAKFIEQVAPALSAYANSSSKGVVAAIESARNAKLAGGLANEDAVKDFLLNRRFTRSQVSGIEAAFVADEHRPMETRWDVVTGITAYARTIPYQNERVELEERAGALM